MFGDRFVCHFDFTHIIRVFVSILSFTKNILRQMYNNFMFSRTIYNKYKHLFDANDNGNGTMNSECY